MMRSMKITINGKKKDLAAEITLERLISDLCKNNDHVIAELNGCIVKSDQWVETNVQDGDMIELVTFVGGG